MTGKDECVYKAKLAEQAERYEEMKDEMKKVVKTSGTLTTEERNLLSVAYKNVIGARRASWRVLTSLEKNQLENTKDENSESKAELTKKYRESVEGELKDICQDILDLLDNELINKAEDAESKVFYQKMKGDYWRYQAEFLHEDEVSEVKKNSHEAYENAMKVAKELNKDHPIRLGLALNFSVFYYEIMNEPDKACKLAKEAFEEALPCIEDNDQCKDSTLILQLLRDNMTLWTSESQADEDIEDKDT